MKEHFTSYFVRVIPFLYNFPKMGALRQEKSTKLGRLLYCLDIH